MHKLNSLSISGVLIFIVTVPLICSSYALRQNDKLRGISVIASLPVVIVSDSLRAFNITDTISIYSFHEFELYQLPRTRKFETEEEIAGTETYFIYKKGAENGFWFESLTNMDAWKKLPVDSFLRSRGNRGLDFTINEKYLLLDVTKKTNGDLLQKYIYTGDHDENTPDSFFYYFTNQNIDFDYSFSKKMDSLSGMKLYQLNFLINEKHSASTPYIIPKREYHFEIRKVNVSGRKDILNFIQYFQAHQPD